jgi:hypothetical protein
MSSVLIIQHLKNSNLYSYQIRDHQNQLVQEGVTHKSFFQNWFPSAEQVGQNEHYLWLKTHITHEPSVATTSLQR